MIYSYHQFKEAFILKAIVTIVQKKSVKTNNTYNIILITFENGVEVECCDFNAVRDIQHMEALIKALHLD